MSKERRLGRGLEALLGRAPRRVDPPVGGDEEGAPHRRVDASHLGEDEAAIRPRPVSLDLEPRPSAFAPRSIAQQAVEDAMAMEREAIVELSVGPGQPREPETGVVQVDVHLIEGNPYQPRREFTQEDIDGLAGSIKEHGLLQPLVVRRVDESYQLIAGERRLRAAQQVGCREVPVKVVEADERRMAELALVENLQRKDLGPLEKAASFQRYLQTHGCTQAELASRLHLDRSTVANFIRLLELPYPVQEMLRSGDLTQGHARALLPLGDEDLQSKMGERIRREGLNVRQVEQLVQETIAQADAEPLAAVEPTRPRSSAPTAKDDQLASLEQEFRSALGMKVKLSHNARGRGKLVVHFSNHDEFERLRERVIGGPPS